MSSGSAPRPALLPARALFLPSAPSDRDESRSLSMSMAAAAGTPGATPVPHTQAASIYTHANQQYGDYAGVPLVQPSGESTPSPDSPAAGGRPVSGRRAPPPAPPHSPSRDRRARPTQSAAPSPPSASRAQYYPLPSPSLVSVAQPVDHEEKMAIHILTATASPVPALRNLQALAATYSERRRGPNQPVNRQRQQDQQPQPQHDSTSSAFGRDTLLTVQRPPNSRLASLIATRDSLAAQLASPASHGMPGDATVSRLQTSSLGAANKREMLLAVQHGKRHQPTTQQQQQQQRQVDPDQDVRISPWTLRFVAVAACDGPDLPAGRRSFGLRVGARKQSDDQVRPVGTSGKYSDEGVGAAEKKSHQKPSLLAWSPSTADERAAALEHQYLVQYFSSNLVEIQRAMLAAILVWLLFIINDAFKETQGLRQHFSSIILLRILDSVVGLIAVGLFQTKWFQAQRRAATQQDTAVVVDPTSIDATGGGGSLHSSYYARSSFGPRPSLLAASSWRASIRVRLRFAVKYVEEVIFFVLYLFGVSQILFGLWQNDSFDPTYSLIVIILPSMCATFFRQRYLFTLAYSSLLLCTFVVLTGAFLDDVDEQRRENDASATSSTFQFAETVIGLAVCICIFTFFSYRKERLLRQDFLAGVRLACEEKKSLHLLAKMLPLSVISQLKLGDEFIYEHHPAISILFSHIAHFDSLCLLATTRVSRATGETIPASDVKPGMELTGEDGRVARVKSVHTIPNQDRLYQVVTASTEYTVTHNHRLTLRWNRGPSVAISQADPSRPPLQHQQLARLVLTWFDRAGVRRTMQWAIQSLLPSTDEPLEVLTEEDEANVPHGSSAILPRVVGTSGELRQMAWAFLDQTTNGVRQAGELIEVTPVQLRQQWHHWRMDSDRGSSPRGAQHASGRLVPIAQPIVLPPNTMPVNKGGGPGVSFTVVARANGAYTPLQAGDEVAIAYQLLGPLASQQQQQQQQQQPEQGFRQLHARGDTVYTFLGLDRVHRALAIDPYAAHLAISELHPTADGKESSHPTSLTTAAYDTWCLDNCSSLLHAGVSRIVAFGRFSRWCWLQHQDALADRGTASQVVTTAGIDVLEMTVRGRRVEIVFAPHPAAWDRAIQLQGAIALAHGRAAPNPCSSFEVDPIVSVRPLSGRADVVNIEVWPDERGQQRYALSSGTLTHNSVLLHPIDLISLLNNLFSAFDDLSDELKVFKVETVGDCYLVAAGCPREYAREDHAAILAVMALDMRALVAEEFQMSALLEMDSSLTIGLQIGIHSGGIIAGVVGVSYPRFRLMGDTINCASRMSTTCAKGDIQLSQASFDRLPKGAFQTEPRGEVYVKGKGMMLTYYLHSQQRHGGYGAATAREHRPANVAVPRRSIAGGTHRYTASMQLASAASPDDTPTPGGETPMEHTRRTTHQQQQHPHSKKDADSQPLNGATHSPPATTSDAGFLSATTALQEMIKLKSRSMLAGVHQGDSPLHGSISIPRPSLGGSGDHEGARDSPLLLARDSPLAARDSPVIAPLGGGGGAKSPTSPVRGSLPATIVTAFSDAPPSCSVDRPMAAGSALASSPAMNGARARAPLHAQLPALSNLGPQKNGLASGPPGPVPFSTSKSDPAAGDQTFVFPLPTSEPLSTIDASPSPGATSDSTSSTGLAGNEPISPLSPWQPLSPGAVAMPEMNGLAAKLTSGGTSTPHRRSFSVAPSLTVRVPGTSQFLPPSSIIQPPPHVQDSEMAPIELVELASSNTANGAVVAAGGVGASDIVSRPKSKPASYYSSSQSKYIPTNHGYDVGRCGSPALELPPPPTVFLSDGDVLLPQSEAIAAAVSQATTPRTHGASHLGPPNRASTNERGGAIASMHRRRATLDVGSKDLIGAGEKVAQFTKDLAMARAKVASAAPAAPHHTTVTVTNCDGAEGGEGEGADACSDMTVVSAAAASKSPQQSFAAFFSLPIKELLQPPNDVRSWSQRLTHSFLPVHPELEAEYHLFFRARSLQINRRAVFSVILVIFALSFYEQVSDLESPGGTARGIWSCHFLAFGAGLVWLWVATYRTGWYIRHLNLATLLILCLQSVCFITVCLFFDTLGTAYDTGMCLLLLSVISMASSLNFLYALVASLFVLAYYAVASTIWYGTVPGIILMLIAGVFFYVRSAWDSSSHLREIFLRKRNQVAETNLSMQLLDNMLPAHILQLMRLSEFIALAHVEADILFSDIVGFTALAAQSQPIDLVAILNVMFSSFDRECMQHGTYKVETIGDAYLACCGVVSHPVDHTRSLVNCGLGFQRITEKFRTGVDQRPLVIRVGIHTGPVVSGVIGKKMPRYHLFGESVTIAETMEQKAPPGSVCISETTRLGLERLGCLHEYTLEPLTSVMVHVHATDGVMSTRQRSGQPPAELSASPRTHRLAREKIQIEMKRYIITHEQRTAREIANTMLPTTPPAAGPS